MKFKLFLFLFFIGKLNAAAIDDVRAPIADRQEILAHNPRQHIDIFCGNLRLLSFRQINSEESYEKLLSCLYFLQETTTDPEAKREVTAKINLYNGVGPFGEPSSFVKLFGREASLNVLGTAENHRRYIRKTLKKNKLLQQIEVETEKTFRSPEIQQMLEAGRANPLTPEEMAAAVNTAMSSPGIQALLAPPIQRPEQTPAPAPEQSPAAPNNPAPAPNQETNAVSTRPQTPLTQPSVNTPAPTKNYYAPAGLAALFLCVYGYSIHKEYNNYRTQHEARSALEQQKNPLKTQWEFFTDRFMQLKLSLSDAALIGLVVCAAATLYTLKS
jgi:hypothetical protein